MRFCSGLLLLVCSTLSLQAATLSVDYAKLLGPKKDFTGTVPHLSAPLMIEGATASTVVAASAKFGLTAFNGSNGKVLWKLPVTGGVEGGLAYDRKLDLIYFGANDGQFYAVSASQGKVQWTFKVQSDTLGEPTIGHNLVFFLAGNNVVFALNKETGQRVWSYGRKTSSEFSIRGASQPYIEGDRLYVGFADGVFACLDIKDGSAKWEKLLNQTRRFKDIDALVVADDTSLFVTSFDDAIYRLDKSTGDIIWRVSMGSYGRIVRAEKSLLVSLTEGAVVALDSESGKVQWKFKTEGTATSPLVGEGVVFTTEAQGRIYALSLETGLALASFETGSGISAALIFGSDKRTLFAVSNRGVLYRFRYSESSNGRQQRQVL